MITGKGNFPNDQPIGLSAVSGEHIFTNHWASMLNTLLGIILFVAVRFTQPEYKVTVTQPAQPLDGPGGQDYQHEEVHVIDRGDKPDGFWLFLPAAPKPRQAHVLTFIHGYGGYNPMIYGGWIKHLVRKGNIVIYPRYQRNLISPAPDKFASNVAKAIREALDLIRDSLDIQGDTSHFSLIGHSYGGIVAADLAINFEKYEVPKAAAVMLCAPGTGKFKGGRLDSYADMPADTKLLIVVNEDDWVVGDEMGIKIFQQTSHLEYRNLLRQHTDSYGWPPIEAHHNQTYALDTLFDNGMRNYTARKALRIGRADAVDYYCYWKLSDALLAFSRTGQWKEYAFGGTLEQCFMGYWSDGTPIRPLEFVPDQH